MSKILQSDKDILVIAEPFLVSIKTYNASSLRTDTVYTFVCAVVGTT